MKLPRVLVGNAKDPPGEFHRQGLCKLEKWFPLQGEQAHSLYFLEFSKNKIERREGGGGGGGGVQNNNIRPINLPKVITFSSDYKYTPPNPNIYHTQYTYIYKLF